MRMVGGVFALAAALLVAGACGGSKSTDLLKKDAGTGGTGGTSSCKTSLDCSKDQVCDKASGQCVDCLTASDCKSGDKCIGNMCRPPCTTDKDCTPVGLLCDTSKGACVQCVQSTDCSGTEFCASGICKPQVCQPGKSICQGNGIATCNVDGSSQGTPVPCNGTKVCVQLAGGPICQEPDAGTGGTGGTTGTGGVGGTAGSAGSGGCGNTSTDSQNCGGCGKVCASIHGTGTCSGGKCTLKCNAGYADCDGDASDGCEASLSTNANCGACGVACGAKTCGTSIAATMGTQPGAGWHFNGTAFYDVSAHTAVLTPAASDAAGTVFYGTPVMTDSFTAKFDFRIGGGTNGADGIAFALQTKGPTSVTATSGGAMGVAGLDGFGVEFDTYGDGTCGDGPNNHIGIDPLTGCTDQFNHFMLTSTNIVTNLPVQLRNSGWQTSIVQVTKGSITVTLAGTTVVKSYAIPGFAAAGYYFGFGAGTGLWYDRQEVRNVSFTFPSPHCL